MFPRLTTRRLLLQEVQPADQAFLFEGLSDRIAMPYNGIHYDTYEDVEQQLEWYDSNWRTGTGISWKITDRESGEATGVISVYYYKPEHRKAEVGYWLLPRFWGKGICSEAMQAVIAYWHRQKGLHRLEAYVEPENGSSIRVLERAGFQREGTLRDCEIKAGRYISLHVYSRLLP